MSHTNGCKFFVHDLKKMLIELKSRMIPEFETNKITRKEMKNMNKRNNEATIILIFVIYKIEFLRLFFSSFLTKYDGLESI